MQKMKKIFLAFLLCLTACAVSPTAAFAEISAEEAQVIEQTAEENLMQIVNMEDPEIDQLEAQFNRQRKGKIANGLDSWKVLRQDIGPFTSLEKTEVREGDDGYIATMNITCGNRTATVQMTFDVSSGEMTDVMFNKDETLGEKLSSAGMNLVIGMGTVFLVLIFIAFLISRFKYINKWQRAREEREKEKKKFEAEADRIRKMPAKADNVSKRISADQVRSAVIPEGTTVRLVEGDKKITVARADGEAVDPQTVAVIAAAVAASEGPDPQLLAVLTAAVMAYEAENGADPGPDGLVVRSIRRVSRR